MANNMRPIHPGEILREELTEIGISANAFAAAILFRQTELREF